MDRSDQEMAEAVLTPLDNQVNRNSKDSVFCDLFEHPEYLLQLYTALHPEDNITEITDITLVTLDHKLLKAQYNDLGFIVRNRLLVLVEAQSTWTLNILVRFLMYLGETYQRYIRNNNLRVYDTTTVEIPKPELYVIYPYDRGNRPDEISLAKDVFGIDDPDQVFVDVKAKIIYDSQKGDIINQYIAFCRVFDEQIKTHGRTRKAIEETIRICKDRDVLKSYLAQEEVADLMFGYFDYEKELEYIRQDERREGREEGREEGENMLGSLITELKGLGRVDDAFQAASDPAYREKLYKEFKMA